MTFRKPCRPDQSGRKSPLWEVSIFLCLTVGGRREVVAATDSSIRLRRVREAGMRAEKTMCKGRKTTDLKSQTDLSSDHHLLFLFSKPQLPQLYSEFPNTSWRSAMRTNDKAGKDLAGKEARRQGARLRVVPGAWGPCSSFPGGWKSGPGRRRPSRVRAPVQHKQSPLQPPRDLPKRKCVEAHGSPSG